MKIFIRRSDGIIQRYSISSRRAKSYDSEMSYFSYQGHKRKRRVYFSPVAARPSAPPTPAPRHPMKTMGGVGYEDVRKLSHVKEIRSDSPIPDMKGQLHVKLRAYKGQMFQTAEGSSYKYDPPFDFQTKERMQRQAFAMAYAQIPFSPESIRVMQIDYRYFIPLKK